MFSSISVSVSDDDSEDIEKMRVRVKRKRKKLASRGGKNVVFRLVWKWWPVLVCVPVVALLLFEASRIRAKPNGEADLYFLNGRNLNQHDMRMRRNERANSNFVEKESKGNLNRMDMPTKSVNGTKIPCLKILPLEEIQRLDFPLSEQSKLRVKRVVYKSVSNKHLIGGNDTVSQQLMEATRFNLFTGYQTLEEREESFKVNETAVVNCGFYSENGGFEVSDDDKSYLRTCKAVVSTCAFGGGDGLYQPIGMSQASLKKVCYVAFWDEITRSTQEAEGNTIGEDHMIGKWRVVVVQNLPFADQRLNGKIPKMLSHRLFSQARYSIWVDSKSQFRRDPLGVFEALLWRTDSVLAISEHGARSTVYDEGNAVIKKHKATPEEVEVQLNQYRKDGLPKDKRFRGKKALAEASVIVREHTPLTNLFMCLWFNEVVRFTSRDQLSFPYVLWRLKVLKINMFDVCTRKSLVNSIGHTRKVKPLII